jgi:ABC-2 type transport system ATP-binding protein
VTAPAILVEQLCKTFGPVAAVTDVSFRIETGELVGFLGLNGAGKSTTMKILTTYLPASSGRASVAGFDVMHESLEVRKNLGYLPESVPLPPEMRVEEYLRMRAQLKQVVPAERRSRLDYCLDRSRTMGVRTRLIGTLSKGYRQRVGLADALLSDPPVLILDEPLSGLDPLQQEETLKTVKELRGQHTVLFSSHQLSDVEKICDRVLMIHRGQLKFDGTISQIAKRTPSVVVEVKANADDATKLFATLDGVGEVQATALADGWQRYSMTMTGQGDVRESLARRCAEKGWGLRSLELRREKLEDTFLKVAYQRS